MPDILLLDDSGDYLLLDSGGDALLLDGVEVGGVASVGLLLLHDDPMLIRQIKKGATDQSVIIRILDSATFLPETSVEHNTSGIDLWYRREGATKTSITEASLASLDAAHSDGGIEHISDGYYRLDLPDAAFATGANGVAVGGTVTDMVVIGCYVALVDYDPQDGVRLGLTALPNAAADAAGGLPISDAGGLDLDAKIGALTFTVAGKVDANTTHAAGTAWGSGAITAASIASDAITAEKIATGAIDADALAADAAVEIAAAVWDRVLTGATHNIATSAGRRLRELGTTVIRTGTAQAGAANSITLDASASSTSEVYDENLITILSGTGAGQSRIITDYNGTTKVATVARNWEVNPDNTSEFQIVAFAMPTIIEHGLAQAGDANSITLASTASSTDDIYNGLLVFLSTSTGAGQVRLITDYNGATKVATVTPAWAVNPASSSVYKITPFGPTVWNADWDAEVQSEVTDALNAYDPPTNAELEARTLVAADYATAANQATIAAFLDTEIAAILEDTGATIPAQIAALNNLSASQVNAEVDAALADVGLTTTVTGRIDAAISTRLASASYTSPLDAAGVRSAVGLASANLDDQLNALPTAAENATAVLTTVMAEDYAAAGAEFSLLQFAYLVHQSLFDSSRAGVTWTIKELDQTTTAATATFDDADNPTGAARAT